MSTEKRHQEFLRKAQKGLDRAAQAARERGRRCGTPVWIWENGKWVDALTDDPGRSYQRSPEPGAVVREEPEEE